MRRKGCNRYDAGDVLGGVDGGGGDNRLERRNLEQTHATAALAESGRGGILKRSAQVGRRRSVDRLGTECLVLGLILVLVDLLNASESGATQAKANLPVDFRLRHALLGDAERKRRPPFPRSTPLLTLRRHPKLECLARGVADVRSDSRTRRPVKRAEVLGGARRRDIQVALRRKGRREGDGGGRRARDARWTEE